jgi:VanZ family protein
MDKDPKNSMRHGRVFRYVPLILWIGLVLFASTTGASMSNTSYFVRPLLEFLFPDAPEATLLLYHGYVRKFAHFAEYAVLAFFAARAFRGSGKSFLRESRHLAALILVLAVASTDEINQSFNPTRTGSFYDVLIDLAGGIFMIILLLLIGRFQKTEEVSLGDQTGAKEAT